MNGKYKNQSEVAYEDRAERGDIIEASYCAILHYVENKSQKEIAKELDMSPAKVSRLLNFARERGIVKFDLNVPRVCELEINLVKKFEVLKDACVVAIGKLDEEVARRQLGRAAARYIQKFLDEHEVHHFACGSGRTLFEFTEALEKTPRKIEVYSLSSSFPASHNVFANIIAGIIAAKWGSKQYNWLPEQTRLADIPEEILKEERKRIKEGLEDSNVAMIIGIGCLDLSEGGTLRNMIEAGLLAESELALLKERKDAVADVNLQIINKEGEIIECEINKKSIPVKLEKIREIASDKTKNARVIGVASGEKKINAIKATLKGKLINVLITDDVIAEKLLEEE